MSMHEGWARLAIWPWPESIDPDLEQMLAAYNIDLGYEPSFEGESGCVVEEENGIRMLSVTDAIASEGIETWRGLLPELRKHGLAYSAFNEGSDGLDGQEESWHPGMAEPFVAPRLRDGRVLEESTFGRMVSESNDDGVLLSRKIFAYFSFDPFAWKGGNT